VAARSLAAQRARDWKLRIRYCVGPLVRAMSELGTTSIPKCLT